MKIAVKNINGEQSDAALKLQKYYVVSDSYDFAGNDATEVTSASNLFLYWDKGFMDFIKFRDSIKANVLPNFSALNEDDRSMLVTYFIYPDTFTQEDIDELFDSSTQIDNWKKLMAYTKEARAIRWEATRRRVSFDVSDLESLLFYTDTKPFKDDFIDANLPHLILWLSNGTYPPLGINYATTGFASKTYYTDARRNICLDILVNGNY